MLEIGDYVKIISNGMQGKIMDKKYTHQNVYYTVFVNNKRIILTESSIEKVDYVEKSSTLPTINFNIQRDSNFCNEIMLRHQTVDIALLNLDKFIDSAICNRVCFVKIIHGRSGGILKAAVHKYLDNNPYVLDYRLGNYYEGSVGVTMAKLK
ncbi:MAG: Smr/MutS family protein [Clostridia bacterium]